MQKIEKLLLKTNYKSSFTNGFMLFIYGGVLTPPYFRRGLIKAQKRLKHSKRVYGNSNV